MDEILEEILSQALESDIGLVISTNDFPALRMKLYQIKKRKPEFSQLSFLNSPEKPDEDLWVIKRKLKDEESETTEGNSEPS